MRDLPEQFLAARYAHLGVRWARIDRLPSLAFCFGKKEKVFKEEGGAENEGGEACNPRRLILLAAAVSSPS